MQGPKRHGIGLGITPLVSEPERLNSGTGRRKSFFIGIAYLIRLDCSGVRACRYNKKKATRMHDAPLRQNMRNEHAPVIRYV